MDYSFFLARSRNHRVVVLREGTVLPRGWTPLTGLLSRSLAALLMEDFAGVSLR